MAARHVEFDLAWIPREENVEADALANGNAILFGADLGVKVDFTSLSWIVLDDMLKAGSSTLGCVPSKTPRLKKRRVQRLPW